MDPRNAHLAVRALQSREVALSAPAFQKLTSDQLNAKVHQLANDIGANASTDRVALALTATTQHQNAHMINLLENVGASGMEIGRLLMLMQTATHTAAAQLGDESKINAEEAAERQDLAARFQTGKTNIKLTEAEKAIKDLQTKHAAEITEAQAKLQTTTEKGTAQLKQKIQEQIDAAKDSQQKSILMGLMTLSNLVQAYSGGSAIKTGIELALTAGVGTLAGRAIINSLLENPVVKGISGAAGVLGKIRDGLVGSPAESKSQSAINKSKQD